MSFSVMIFRSLFKRRVICKIIFFIILLIAAQLCINYLYHKDLVSESLQPRDTRGYGPNSKLDHRHMLSKDDSGDSLKAPFLGESGSVTPEGPRIREFYQRQRVADEFNVKRGDSSDTGAMRRQEYLNQHQQSFDSDVQHPHRSIRIRNGEGNLVLHGINGDNPQPDQVKYKQWETYDYENAANLLQISVDKAPDHREGQGQPWPMPQKYTPGSMTYKVDMDGFTIISPPESCGRLTRAVDRYTKKIHDKVDLFIPDGFQYRKLNGTRRKDKVIRSLNIELLRNCQDTDLPHEHMSEQYHITVHEDGAKLSASEVWGVIRGLETFSQLIWFDEFAHHAVIDEVFIQDYPRFSFRGLHIDTARHFIPMRSLFKLMDAMSYNKLNVLQWHITDDQSFPFVSKTFPLLHKKGAYSKRHVYKPLDVKALIQYGADRAIRLIPEFDLPGHTRSWGLGYPKLLTNCSANHHPFGAVNPINNYTYDFLKLFWGEIRQVFPDNYQHVGGDEINYKCWLAVKEIREFMLSKNMTRDNYNALVLDGDQLQGYFLKRLLEVMPKDKLKIAWEEAFSAAQLWNISTDELIINVWKGGDYEWQYVMESIVRSGYRTILSAPWYLNYISYGTDWHKYYSQDPLSFMYYTDEKGKRRVRKEMRRNLNQYENLVLGGQVCLWSEFVDESNLESTLWPRAIAPAEKFWSSAELKDWRPAQARFEQQRCRMSRRGIHTAPNSGPGTCFGTMKIKPPYDAPGQGAYF